MTSPPVLPGTIPGLLRVGAPVVGTLQTRSRGVVVQTEPTLRVWGEDAGRDTGVEPHLIALDLTTEVGRGVARTWLGEQVKMDASGGVTWGYRPGRLPDSVSAWVLRNHAEETLWVTDWRPAFRGFARPTLATEGRLVLEDLPTDAIEALARAVLLAASERA